MRCDDVIRFLREPHQLRVPLHGQTPVAQRFTEQPFVVVLSQDQNERIGAQLAPDVPERHARRRATLRPQVGARAAFAEIERTLDDAKMGINFQRTRLDAQRSGLEGGPGVPVDDHRSDAAAPELIGEHESGRSGSNDENVSIHVHAASVNRRSVHLECGLVKWQPYRPGRFTDNSTTNPAGVA